MISPAPDQIWPVSVAGWIALFTGFISLIAVIFAWGKFFGKLEELITEVKQLKEIDEQRNEDYTILKHIIMGPLGNNGLVSKVDLLNREVRLITERNTKIDAVNARESGAQEAGIESRHHTRRKEDRILRGEDDAS